MPIQLDADFHDGTMHGFWFEGDNFHLLLSTAERVEYVLLVRAVLAVYSTGFGRQNIVFDVQVRESHELTEGDIREVYAVLESPNTESRLAGLLESAQARRAVFVVVDPSCGANCLVLGKSVELLRRNVNGELC